ncbi:MAG: hypothetical protein CTY14_05385 [Methylotenera sp.]|nr:MAG: hypothetical protein CTY14_05385 [Methylotenera sp.]
MLRLIVTLTGLSCAILVGCEGNVDNHARENTSDISLHDAKLRRGDESLCLTNFYFGIAECNKSIIGQKRMVLIRGELLPLEE